MRWLVPLVLLTGCHLLIGHEPPAASRSDLASLDLAVDRSTADNTLVDRTVVDRPSAELLPPPCTTCMRDGKCQAAISAAACGANGGPCSDCTTMPSLPCKMPVCAGGVCSLATKPCQSGQACSNLHQGECCACIFLGICVKVPSDAQCGIGGGECQPCDAPVCRTSACDPAKGICLQGPNVLDGTSCKGGKCSQGICCADGGCAASGACVDNLDTACGSGCLDCTKNTMPTSCTIHICVNNTCTPGGNAPNGSTCEVGLAQGTCSSGHCCTNGGCFDAAGTGTCSNTDKACGPSCLNCSLGGVTCNKGSCG